MRQTDIKTIYLTGEEIKQCIADFISERSPDLARLVTNNSLQLQVTDHGVVIRIPHEIETYNDELEYAVNE